MDWKFEKRVNVAQPTSEINVLLNKLTLARAMLAELGYLEEFNRLAEKYIKEKAD